MSSWSRFANVFRGDRVIREIDEELESHVAEAIEHGRDPADARRAFGSALRRREESRDVRLISWLDALRADAICGWGQLRNNRVTSAVAILSLGLAIGASTSAFRLVDALLLRALPVAEPGRLSILSRQGTGPDGKPQLSDGCEYPLFRQMRAATTDQAELIAISYPERMDLTYGLDREMEKADRQYVSGWMFESFGLRPALGRLLTRDDDLQPRAHPYAVLSHDYWRRRFAQDPNVIGRTFRTGNDSYEIVGVAEERFTGTDPGTVTDIFIPTMMHPGVERADWSWFRTWVRPKPGVAAEPVLERLRAAFRAFREETAKTFLGRPPQSIDRFLDETLSLKSAAAGVSTMQKEYDRSLAALSAVVVLVLLIACANTANLMTAQAAARAREMALRVSIGAGRGRLVQLVLVQSAWLACLAAAIGGLFAWWSAPFVVSMINPPDNPVRLMLPADWRVLGFGLALTVAVTFLCGLAPALRVSAVKPISALKAGGDQHSRRHSMQALIAVQVGLCFLVLFLAGLFVATFIRLSRLPTGFSAERLLVLDTVAQRAQPALWDQVAEHLRAVPGVEKVAMAGWPLLSGNGWNPFVSIDGAPPVERRPSFLNVSPGWVDVMKIPFIDGRDFRASDAYPSVAIVNDAFAKQYFSGGNPIGKWFEETPSRGDALPAEAAGARYRVQIVGLVRDARYRTMRELITPTAYVPFQSVDARGAWEPISWGTFIVRTSSAQPLTLAPILRWEVTRARPEFRVSHIHTQMELNQSHTVRERLLAVLALFFAVVALLLAGAGLYGVLHYSVLQRRREIGIRMALGSRAGRIARRMTVEVFSMVLVGALAGLTLGLASARYLGTLFYQVNPTEPAMIALPSLTILAVAVLAAAPPVIHAVRIDPVTMLRSE
jgi:putative ABC transport system permease protein